MKNTTGIALLLFLFSTLAYAGRTPEELVKNLNDTFSGIRDAEANITLDTSLQIFGCGGLYRQSGHLYFKAPDKVMAELDKTRYFIKGNNIRKIDPEGKRYYIRLIHAPDFTPGFNPRLITHNFNLKIVSQTSDEVALEGLPKPGVLKNVKKVVFHIDTKNNLLRSMDLAISGNLKGKVDIKYEKMGGLAVPTATSGKSALEFDRGFLVGLYFNLSGKNFKVNQGLPDKLFDPGF